MNTPDDLRYSSDHEWIRRDGDVITIGITDYAQDSLGDVVFVEQPEVGQTVAASDTFTEVESTKSVSDIYAPVSGTITETNTSARGASGALELATRTARDGSAGSRCPIRASSTRLLDAAAYRQLTEG